MEIKCLLIVSIANKQKHVHLLNNRLLQYVNQKWHFGYVKVKHVFGNAYMPLPWGP